MKRGDVMEYSFHLAFDAEGGLRMTRGEGALARNERGMGVTLRVPLALFRTPSLSAKIEITDPGLPRPTIDVEAASRALKEVVGCDVQITVSTPEGD